MIMTTSQRMELTSINSNLQTVATLTKTDLHSTSSHSQSTTASEELISTPEDHLVSDTSKIVRTKFLSVEGCART